MSNHNRLDFIHGYVITAVNSGLQEDSLPSRHQSGRDLAVDTPNLLPLLDLPYFPACVCALATLKQPCGGEGWIKHDIIHFLFFLSQAAP